MRHTSPDTLNQLVMVLWLNKLHTQAVPSSKGRRRYLHLRMPGRLHNLGSCTWTLGIMLDFTDAVEDEVRVRNNHGCVSPSSATRGTWPWCVAGPNRHTRQIGLPPFLSLVCCLLLLGSFEIAFETEEHGGNIYKHPATAIGVAAPAPTGGS